MRKGLLCTVLCAATAAGLAASACFPRLFAQAKAPAAKNSTVIHDLNKSSEEEMVPQNMDDDFYEGRPIIIYELGDPNFHVPADEGNTIVHDLNMSAEEEHALYQELFPDDFYYERPIIIYELGDERMPAIDWDNVDDVHILEEPTTRGDYAPGAFYNLAFEDYHYSFSNVKEYVYTDFYFSTNANGFISVSTNGINNPVYIAMVERESGQVVSSWQGDPSTISGLGFPGNPTKLYYFIFKPYGVSSVSGSGNIFWDN